MFITFEGIDGSGKSTQAIILRDRLLQEGYKVILTHLPGGTELGQKIRKLVLNPREPICPLTELMLYLADRAQTINQIILPGLNNGYIVICDRFDDSTRAYQGGGRNMGESYINDLLNRINPSICPNLTFWLDISVNEGLSRARAKRSKLDRFEGQDKDFYDRVRSAYLKTAILNQDRIQTIPVLDQSREEIAQTIWKITKEKL